MTHYVFPIVVILLLLASSSFLQTKFSNMLNLGAPNILSSLFYGIVLIILFSVICYFLWKNKKTDEGFFFEVSKCNPRCSGIYKGKPTTFQFSEVGRGDCKDEYHSYGMIKDCSDPACATYGQGHFYQ